MNGVSIVFAYIGGILGIVNAVMRWRDRRRRLKVCILPPASKGDSESVRACVTNPSEREINIGHVRLMALFKGENQWRQLNDNQFIFTRRIPGSLPPHTSSNITFSAYDSFPAKMATNYKIEIETETGKVFTCNANDRSTNQLLQGMRWVRARIGNGTPAVR